jgi:hypothetical protein
MLGTVDITTLHMLYGIRSVGRNAIAKELALRTGLTPRTALRKLKSIDKLKEKKLVLTIGYSLAALGLKGVIIFSRDETALAQYSRANYFLRSSFPLIPFGGGIALYAPSMSQFHLPKSSDVYVFQYVERLRNRTNFLKYGIKTAVDPEVATSTKSLLILKNETISKIKKLDERNLNPHEIIGSPAKFDWIDLTIIKELEKDPLKKLDEIASSVRLPLSKIMRHSSKHVVQLIHGIRIRYLPVYTYFDSHVMIKVKGRDALTSIALAQTLVENPLFPTVGIGNDVRELIVQITSPFSLLRKILKSFISLCNDLGTDVDTENLWLISVGGKRFTIPYIKWEEYIPRVKWNADLLSKVISEKLRRGRT